MTEADKAMSRLRALSIVKVSDIVAYTRRAAIAARSTSFLYMATCLPSRADIQDGRHQRQRPYAAMAPSQQLLAWPGSYPLRQVT